MIAERSGADHLRMADLVMPRYRMTLNGCHNDVLSWGVDSARSILPDQTVGETGNTRAFGQFTRSLDAKTLQQCHGDKSL